MVRFQTGNRFSVGYHRDQYYALYCFLYIYIYIYIYINDLEDDVSSKVLKFADDTKLFRKVTNDTDKKVYRIIWIN